MSEQVPRLSVRTRRIAAPADPLLLTDPASPQLWAREDRMLVGSGRALRLAETGSDRAARLAARWREIAGAAQVDDEVRIPGTGLVALGAFAFDDEAPEPSVLDVPRRIVGRDGEVAWCTTVTVDGEEAPLPDAIPEGPAWSTDLREGALSAAGYGEAVRTAVAEIAAGRLEKVVLARDLVGTAPAGADLRPVLRRLAEAYPETWVFAIDGVVGASPETLLTVAEGRVTARVLAGTAARGADEASDETASTVLRESAKDQSEHRFAVQSLQLSLAAHLDQLHADPEPALLALPNLWHLSTDVAGLLSDASSALDLVAAVHPTAAVGGTPTPEAVALIRRLEPAGRGRYAGPVGWVDGHGDGEWAIALRCAQFGAAAASGIPIRAHAGAGIVAASVPAAEIAETEVKFRPVVDALRA